MSTPRVLYGIILAVFAVAALALAADAPKAEVYTAWPFDAAEASKRQDGTAKALGIPKEQDVDLGDGVKITFILIPAGKYKMGDAPGRDVTIDKPFYMGKFEVTQAQYEKIAGKNPSHFQGKDNPVDSVCGTDALEFCKKASETTKKNIRLSTEQEWEWACRAGTATRCYWGDDMTVLGDYCWWHDNCEGKTHPVGQKKPNAFGLYDILGNVAEWCSGGGPDAKNFPYRGVMWGSREPMFRSTFRGSGGALGTYGVPDRFGFRVAMDVE